SGFLVGAAVQLNNGVVLGGCNQENASYPLCMCGERVALYNAAANYPHQSVVSLAIVARNPRKKLTQPVSPCGACRQVIAEYESRYGSDIRIILKGETNDVIIFDTIKELLPYGFDGTFL
ncbi:MAG TPA: cytidine deaminase, partial [Saprospirales bacterium]|nr:cytidine deaminase [Saprospirales bacterium]